MVRQQANAPACLFVKLWRPLANFGCNYTLNTNWQQTRRKNKSLFLSLIRSPNIDIILLYKYNFTVLDASCKDILTFYQKQFAQQHSYCARHSHEAAFIPENHLRVQKQTFKLITLKLSYHNLKVYSDQSLCPHIECEIKHTSQSVTWQFLECACNSAIAPLWAKEGEKIKLQTLCHWPVFETSRDLLSFLH